MDISTFYALFSATCFTLLGLWWNVLQLNSQWIGDDDERNFGRALRPEPRPPERDVDLLLLGAWARRQHRRAVAEVAAESVALALLFCALAGRELNGPGSGTLAAVLLSSCGGSGGGGGGGGDGVAERRDPAVGGRAVARSEHTDLVPHGPQ